MTNPRQTCIVRHGATARSLSGPHAGRTNLRRTPHGQARKPGLSAALQGLLPALLLTRARLRARGTCALAGLGAAAEVDTDLAAWDHGGLHTAVNHQFPPRRAVIAWWNATAARQPA